MRAFVAHFEIPARDLDRAAAFYRDALGWSVEPVPWKDGGYCRLRMPAAAEALRPAGIPGGLVEEEALGAAHPLVVVHVEDARVGELLERIVSAGGGVAAAPRAVGDHGVFARFRDSEGNELGLWGAA